MVEPGPFAIARGQDGWELVEYVWDEKTGVGRFEYEQGEARVTVLRAQPATPTHAGWYMRR